MMRIRDSLPYPSPAQAIARRIIERDDFRCRFCHARNHALGGHTSAGRFLMAHALGEAMLRIVWPRPGSSSQCGPDHGVQVLRIVRITLTVAPLNKRIEDCRDENLATFCQRCLAIHEARSRTAGGAIDQRSTWATADMFS